MMRRSDLDRIITPVATSDRSPAVIAWTAGLIVTIVVLASAIAAMANLRDDVRVIRARVEEAPPCRQ